MLQFKELMNRIDPDDEEDEDGNPIVNTDPNKAPIPNRNISYRSRGQALAQQNQQQAAMDQLANNALIMQQKEQEKQQNYVKHMENHPLVQKLRPQRSITKESTPQKKNHSVDNYYSNMDSMEGMVLDPETGEMVPAGNDPDDDGDVQVLNNEKPVVIKFGNLTKRSDNSTQVCV